MCAHTDPLIKSRSWRNLLQKDIRDWERKNWPDIDFNKCDRRCIAATETDRDLQKEVQQLLCDNHEEALAPIMTKEDWEGLPNSEKRLHLALQKIMGMNKRMVSLQVVLAYQAQRTTNIVTLFTVIGIIFAFLSLILSGFQVYFAAMPNLQTILHK